MSLRLEKKIQSELDRMDGGLFLDKDMTPYGMVYSVKHLVHEPGGSVSLYTALEWTYPNGTPKPLSDDLTAALRAQEGDISEALRTAMVNNAARKELARQKAHEEADAVAKEWTVTKRAKKFVSHGPGGMDHKTSLNKRDI